MRCNTIRHKWISFGFLIFCRAEWRFLQLLAFKHIEIMTIRWVSVLLYKNKLYDFTISLSMLNWFLICLEEYSSYYYRGWSMLIKKMHISTLRNIQWLNTDKPQRLLLSIVCLVHFTKSVWNILLKIFRLRQRVISINFTLYGATVRSAAISCVCEW